MIDGSNEKKKAYIKRVIFILNLDKQKNFFFILRINFIENNSNECK